MNESVLAEQWVLQIQVLLQLLAVFGLVFSDVICQDKMRSYVSGVEDMQ